MLILTHIFICFLSVASVDVIPNRHFHGDDGSMGIEWERRFGDTFADDIHTRAQATNDEILAEGITVPAWEQGSQHHHRGYTGVDIWSNHVGYNLPGKTGVSYYLRAFDMFPKWYMAQFGWGQWTASGKGSAGTSCARSPRRATCNKVDFPNPALANKAIKDCSWPEGDDRLDQCKFHVCAKEKQPIYGTFEGGMGYWPYMTGSKGVKWMHPGAVSGHYGDKYAGTFLNTHNQPCTLMGGAIQLSNNILVSIDAFSFEKNRDGDTDGMLGYMLQRTPLGKMHPNDNRNFWTVIIDTENFSGPILYASAWHFEHPNSWAPDVKTWVDPALKIDYAQVGMEGGVGVTAVEKDGYYYFRTQDVQIPLDDDGKGFTWATGHAQYIDDWAIDVLEPILDGTSQNPTPSDVLAASKVSRRKASCNARPNTKFGKYRIGKDYKILPKHITLEDINGWGIGDDFEVEDIEQTEAAWCRATMPVNTASPNMTCTDTKCRLTPYFRLPIDGSSTKAELIPESIMSADIKKALDDRADKVWLEPSRDNDGRTLDGPKNDENVCFDNPGPASSTLYCRRTTDERWLSYRWYRFVDQPEMNQVFASLPKDEQMEAKCYMQKRIERFHAMQNKQSVLPKWFDPPGGLPTGKAKLDEGFLVNPPPGFETGYVPVVLYSKLREQPSDCDVVEGIHKSEPEPLPADYYPKPQQYQLYEFDPEMCIGRPESGGVNYRATETLYVSKRDGYGEFYPYKLPLRSEVANGLAAAYDDNMCSANIPVPVPSPPTPQPIPPSSPTPKPSVQPLPATPTMTPGDNGPTDGDSFVTLVIKVDDFPQETYWSLYETDSEKRVHWVNLGAYSSLEGGTVATKKLPLRLLSSGISYTLTMMDEFGDGIVDGFFELFDGNGDLLFRVENFDGFERSIVFDKTGMKDASPSTVIAPQPSAPPVNQNVPTATAGNDFSVTLTIQLDDFPEETSWRIVESDSQQNVHWVGDEAYEGQWNELITATLTLDSDMTYDLIMMDSFGDGILDGGFFELTGAGGHVLARVDDFSTGERVVRFETKLNRSNKTSVQSESKLWE